MPMKRVTRNIEQNGALMFLDFVISINPLSPDSDTQHRPRAIASRIKTNIVPAPGCKADSTSRSIWKLIGNSSMEPSLGPNFQASIDRPLNFLSSFLFNQFGTAVTFKFFDSVNTGGESESMNVCEK